MNSKLSEAQRLIAAVAALPADSFDRLVAASSLADDERHIITAAFADASQPVAELAGRLLATWDVLGPVERTAGLLALAEALAETP